MQWTRRVWLVTVGIWEATTRGFLSRVTFLRKQSLPQDRVKVQLAPEKAGFILKHVNYIVQSSVSSLSAGVFVERLRQRSFSDHL